MIGWRLGGNNGIRGWGQVVNAVESAIGLGRGPITGDALTEASQAALVFTGGGTVTGSESAARRVTTRR